MRENVVYLRSKGKTYKEIAEILKCSVSLIAYHCNDVYRKKSLTRNNASRIRRMQTLKSEFGGKCQRCNYSKCLDALEFHHKNPEEKIGAVAAMIRTHSMETVRLEARKCELICANCHRELHAEENKIILPS